MKMRRPSSELKCYKENLVCETSAALSCLLCTTFVFRDAYENILHTISTAVRLLDIQFLKLSLQISFATYRQGEI